MIRVRSVALMEGFKARVSFTDGTEKVIDLSRYLHGPIFDPIRKDPVRFREMRVDPELGTLVWPNGADICPDVLYHGRTPVSAESQVPAPRE